MDVLDFLKPGHLSFGVATGILLDAGDGLGLVKLTLKMVEELAIADGLEGGKLSVSLEMINFLFQSRRDHIQNPAIDAGIKFLAFEL